MRWLSWHHIRAYTNEVVSIGIAATVFIVVAKAAVNSRVQSTLQSLPLVGPVASAVSEVINRT